MRTDDSYDTAELLEIEPHEELLREGQTENPTPAKPVKNEAADELKETRRALKEMRTALRETSETAKYWMEQSRRPAAAAVAEPEPATSVDLVEAITNNDAKAVAKALREMGVAFDKDVDGKITAAR